jgi:hypothetical protein
MLRCAQIKHASLTCYDNQISLARLSNFLSATSSLQIQQFERTDDNLHFTAMYLIGTWQYFIPEQMNLT